MLEEYKTDQNRNEKDHFNDKKYLKEKAIANDQVDRLNEAVNKYLPEKDYDRLITVFKSVLNENHELYMNEVLSDLIDYYIDAKHFDEAKKYLANFKEDCCGVTTDEVNLLFERVNKAEKSSATNRLLH